jgi:hypothetical protein
MLVWMLFVCIITELGRCFIKEKSGAADDTFAPEPRILLGGVREVFEGYRVDFVSVVMAFQLAD